MILNKNNIETDAFLDVNNDIYRIMTILNDNQEIKRLLTYTTKVPLEKNSKQPDIIKDLRDKQIARQPVFQYDENDGSIIIISFVDGEIEPKTYAMDSIITIDVFTPSNQWIINEGIRPINIVHTIANLMRKELEQTGGVKYRLHRITNAQLSDVLLGYRMQFDTVIDD